MRFLPPFTIYFKRGTNVKKHENCSQYSENHFQTKHKVYYQTIKGRL